MSAKSPNPTDKHVGNRVRMRRMMAKMSQTTLGNAMGISFQKLQKYENGTNRLSAGRLHQLSHILQVSVSFFLEGLLLPLKRPAKRAQTSTAFSPPPMDCRSRNTSCASRIQNSAAASLISLSKSPPVIITTNRAFRSPRKQSTTKSSIGARPREPRRLSA
jgi:transcriptional regulator with XRE-family HTH domain